MRLCKLRCSAIVWWMKSSLQNYRNRIYFPWTMGAWRVIESNASLAPSPLFFILYLLARHCWSLDPIKQLCTWVVKGMESVEFWKKLDCPRTTENWRDIESNPGWTLAPPFLCRTCMLAPALLACFLALLIAEIKGKSRGGTGVQFTLEIYIIS